MLFAQEEEEGPFTCLPPQWVGGNGGGGSEPMPDPDPDPNPSPCSADDPGCTGANNPEFTNPGSDEGLDPDDYEWWEWFDVDPMEIDDYDSYDEYMDGQNGKGDPNNRNSYSITINDDVTPYTDGESVHILESKNNLRLRIRDASSNVFDPRVFHWKRNRSSTTYDCSAVDTCNSIPGATTSTGNATSPWNVIVFDDNQNRLITIKVFIHKKPTLYFAKPKNYQGEFGFDDSAHKYLKDSVRLNAAYQVLKINRDTTYEVPWMSLLDSQSAYIRVRKFWGGDSISLRQNRNDEVFFTPTNPKIRINNLPMFKTELHNLYDLDSLKISATEWDANTLANKSFGSIYATTTNGDTIGKFNLSCAKPLEKKIFFVYVNTGNGFNPISKTQILEFLNKNSCNQIFRKWTLYDPLTDSNVSTMVDRSKLYNLDTITLVNEFNNFNSIFTDTSGSLVDKIAIYFKNIKEVDYKNHLNVSRNNSKDADGKIYFAFILNYSLAPKDSGQTIAISHQGNVTSCFWSFSDFKTYSHEVGHMLDLDHTYESNSKGGFSIPKFVTYNYMDYNKSSFDLNEKKKNMFYFAQWLLIHQK